MRFGLLLVVFVVVAAGCLPVPNSVRRMRDSVNNPTTATPRDLRAEAITTASPAVVRSRIAAVWPDVPVGNLETWSGRPMAAEVVPDPQGARIRLAYYALSREASAPDTLRDRMLALSDTLRQPPVSAGFGFVPTYGDPACLYERGFDRPPNPEADTLDVAPQLLPSQEEALTEVQRLLQYPEMAKRAGIEGRVFVHFVVDPAGVPSCVTVPIGIGGGLDEAAAFAVRSLRFAPGMKDGKPAEAKFAVPITFRLR